MLAVDLGDPAVLALARDQAARTVEAEKARTAAARCVRRAAWLERKAARLPRGSNGQRVALSEKADCERMTVVHAATLAALRTGGDR